MARARPIPEAQPACPGCGFATDPGTGPINFCPSCGADRRGGGAVERTASDVFLDQVIGDRYRLLELLGEGGMGAVYKAEHIRMGKALAVKLLRGDFARDEGAIARFRSEAQIVSRLSHPHTIAVFDFGPIDEVDGFYLAMEYVPGRDLARALKEGGRFEEARAAEIGQQILGSLAEAHDVGIVHRDMKPANVMLMQTRPGEDFAKVLDFGIAKLRDEGTSASTTSAGAIVGTPSYLAPEQARGDAVDARADLYAVGCLLYELVAGRPPFVAPSPMAVVSAHLHEAPPPLASLAPGVSRRFAQLVHRALEKDPAARFQTADDMRDALLGVGDPTSSRPLVPAVGPETTGALRIASRSDFRDFDRQVRSLRRSRVAAPALALGLAAAAVGVVWRWPDLYDLAATRAPALARRLPAALRPPDRFDGAEREPNDVATQANALPLPPGADGAPASGAAAVTGHVGARLGETSGDVDVFRIVVPPLGGRRVLVAEWHAEGDAAEGIRGLDVMLSLNRERSGGRSSAPLVASVDQAGPGRPERLTAGVEPGDYYLSVRERHGLDAVPVEKPTDAYRLEVRLVEPGPGEEVEPNDAPDAVGAREQRYPEWRAVAERNPLAEGNAAHGATTPEDPDVWAVAPRGPAQVIEVVAAIPDPALALSARRWTPDPTDLAPPRNADRVRFERAGEGGPGAVLFVPIAGGAQEGAPALVQLRAAEGEGPYTLLALGPGSASGAAVLALVRELAAAGRLPAALELAAGFNRHVPRAAARAEALVLAGSLAAAAAATLDPDAIGPFDRAAGLLGAAIFEPRDGGGVVYRAAFEARVEGVGPLADAAALRVAVDGAPCSPEAVLARTESFLARHPAPAPALAREARLARARALEARYWSTAPGDRVVLARVLATWRALARGDGGEEANARAAALAVKRPRRDGAPAVCGVPPPSR